jgi:hypothetical protein
MSQKTLIFVGVVFEFSYANFEKNAYLIQKACNFDSCPYRFSPHFHYKYQTVMYFTVSMQGLDTLATQNMGIRERCAKWLDQT